MSDVSLPDQAALEAARRDDERLAAARSVVLRRGWNATAYQILNPGIALWFLRGGDAVVGHVTHAGVRVVAGAPVCTRERLLDVAHEFEQEAARARAKLAAKSEPPSTTR